MTVDITRTRENVYLVDEELIKNSCITDQPFAGNEAYMCKWR